MKRRARLNYSTEYLPFNPDQGHKKVHREDEEHEGDEERNQHNEEEEEEEEEDRCESNEEEQTINEQKEHIKDGQMDEEKPYNYHISSERNANISIEKRKTNRNKRSDQNPYGSNSVKQNENESLNINGRMNRNVDDIHKVDTAEDIIKKKLKINPITLVKLGKENQYGNFRSYYDHRYEKKWSDPRLKVLDRNWFVNKEVLDIGCNDGSFTLQIAIKYFPFKIQGVDIDFNLINKAVSNYILLETQQAKCKHTSSSSLDNQHSTTDYNQQDHYKALKNKLSRLPSSFIIDKTKTTQLLEETFLIQNASSILQDAEQTHNPSIQDNSLLLLNTDTLLNQHDLLNIGDSSLKNNHDLENNNNNQENNDVQDNKEGQEKIDNQKNGQLNSNSLDRNDVDKSDSLLNKKNNDGGVEQNAQNIEQQDLQQQQQIIESQEQQLQIVDISKVEQEQDECMKQNNKIQEDNQIIEEIETSTNDNIQIEISHDKKVLYINEQDGNNSLAMNEITVKQQKDSSNQQIQEQQTNDQIISNVPPPQLKIKRKFPQNTQFRLENYIESIELTEKYDTICCFSTTKWIHLNFGDEGIKRLFNKVYSSLRINGIFILEPQEWRSYKKKQSFSEEFKLILKSIKLHPGEFKQYLLDNYKYVLEKEIVPELNSNKVPAFFKRVVYVFRKVE